MTLGEVIKQARMIDFPRHADQLRTLVAQHQNFSVSLPGSAIGLGMSKKRRKEICHNVLDRLQPSCAQAYIYELNTEEKNVKRHESCLTKNRGRHKLDLAGKSWADFDDLLYKPRILSDISELRGSILLECIASTIPWAAIFPYCADPVVFNNASVGCGKSPIAYARRHSGDDKAFIIVQKTNSGLEWLTIMADVATALEILKQAFKHCPISPIYLSELEIMENV